MTPNDKQRAVDLLNELRDWGVVLRDIEPYGFLPISASDRIAYNAWLNFIKATERLKALITESPDGLSDGAPVVVEAKRAADVEVGVQSNETE